MGFDIGTKDRKYTFLKKIMIIRLGSEAKVVSGLFNIILHIIMRWSRRAVYRPKEQGILSFFLQFTSGELLVLPLRNVHEDMSQRTCLWTPSPMVDSILGIIIQHLDQIVELSTAILPVELADLGIAMEQVQTALAATTATSTNLTDAIGLDGHVVDLIFGERLTTVGRAVEFAPDKLMAC